jgi:ABC-type glycerol-3-phosphate transport system substrate-binding protein
MRGCLLLLWIWVLGGCGSAADREDGKIVVEYWHGMGEREHQELLLRFADEYMRDHPEVDVRPVFQGLYGALYQKLIAAITAGNPPVMAQMYESWTTRLYGRGRLVPVQRLIDGPNGYSPEELDDFFPAFLEDNRWGDQLVTLPFNKSAYVLQYNADLLRRAGFNQAPSTWEELRNAARVVSKLQTEDGRPCRGLMIRPQLESFATIYFSAGGSFLDANGHPQMTGKLARTSMKFLMGMVEEGSAVVDRNYPSVVLGSGTLGMYIYSSASFPFNDRFSEGEFEWKAAPVPHPADAAPELAKTLFQGFNVGLLEGHPDRVTEAAWGFLKYMLEPDQAARWSMQTGYCPIRKTVLEVSDIENYLRENPAYRVPLGRISHASFEPKPDFWESWRTAVGDEVSAALQSIKSVDIALLDAQKAGEEALQYDSKFPSEGDRINP